MCELSEKLLGIKFDHKISLDDHISKLCKKASTKMHALSRVASYINISKRCIFINAFFKSQCSYCPLVWMWHSRAHNGRINRLHQRCLRIINISSHRLKRCWIKMALFLFTIEIFRSLQLKCINKEWPISFNCHRTFRTKERATLRSQE